MLLIRLALLPLMLLVVGCGSDDGASGSAGVSSPVASPSADAGANAFDEQDFRRQAERVCTDFVSAASVEPPNEPEAVVLWLEDAVIAHKDAAARLSALQYPPTEEGAKVRRVLVDGVTRLQADFVTAVADAAQARQRQDRAAFDAAFARISALVPPDQAGILSEYRLPTCAEGFSTG